MMTIFVLQSYQDLCYNQLIKYTNSDFSIIQLVSNNVKNVILDITQQA